MKNSCKRFGCRFAVTSGMQCDNCKGWFHEAYTDLSATAYNRLSKSNHRWECVTCSTDAAVLLSNIIVLLTGLQKESFQQLALYFEILHDPVKRKEYDQKWKAKREAIKRMESMDSSRRKLKEELEAREAAAMALRKRQFETVAKQQAADQIRRDWERHTEEMKWQAERKRKSANEETDDVKFKCTKSDQAVVRVSFNPFLELLLICYLQFGDVIAFVIGKRGSAIAEFSTYNEAKKAIKASERGAVGLPSLPLQLSWLSTSNTNVVSDSINVKDKQVEKDKFMYEPTPNNKLS
ncbi:unnamed protein product [Schistosoma margrebowiei]|uniref:Uncharacterized protein n=1 Tax=Schistosoma margrebowiei TaxID=48269 RepID=A0A183MJP6_9TREM|nr:unnamed protein product [Schistosoma margrebowiei]